MVWHPCRSIYGFLLDATSASFKELGEVQQPLLKSLPQEQTNPQHFRASGLLEVCSDANLGEDAGSLNAPCK